MNIILKYTNDSFTISWVCLLNQKVVSLSNHRRRWFAIDGKGVKVLLSSGEDLSGLVRLLSFHWGKARLSLIRTCVLFRQCWYLLFSWRNAEMMKGQKDKISYPRFIISRSKKQIAFKANGKWVIETLWEGRHWILRWISSLNRFIQTNSRPYGKQK